MHTIIERVHNKQIDINFVYILFQQIYGRTINASKLRLWKQHVHECMDRIPV